MADELPKVGWTPRALQEEEVQDRDATTTVHAGHAAEREYLKDQTLEDQEHRGWPIITRKEANAHTAADILDIIMTGAPAAMCQEIRA